MAFDEEELDPHGECAAEIMKLRRLLHTCREAMRISQRFHPNSTDWRGMIEAIDAEVAPIVSSRAKETKP